MHDINCFDPLNYTIKQKISVRKSQSNFYVSESSIVDLQSNLTDLMQRNRKAMRLVAMLTMDRNRKAEAHGACSDSLEEWMQRVVELDERLLAANRKLDRNRENLTNSLNNMKKCNHSRNMMTSIIFSLNQQIIRQREDFNAVELRSQQTRNLALIAVRDCEIKLNNASRAATSCDADLQRTTTSLQEINQTCTVQQQFEIDSLRAQINGEFRSLGCDNFKYFFIHGISFVDFSKHVSFFGKQVSLARSFIFFKNFLKRNFVLRRLLHNKPAPTSLRLYLKHDVACANLSFWFLCHSLVYLHVHIPSALNRKFSFMKMALGQIDVRRNYTVYEASKKISMCRQRNMRLQAGNILLRKKTKNISLRLGVFTRLVKRQGTLIKQLKWLHRQNGLSFIFFSLTY